jgi:hypothetical protein
LNDITLDNGITSDNKDDLVKLLETVREDVTGEVYSVLTPPKVPYKPKKPSNGTSKRGKSIINTDTPKGKMLSIVSTTWEEITSYINNLPETLNYLQVKSKTNAYVKECFK